MYKTNKLSPWIRYPLAIIVALLASGMFVGLLLLALKVGELLVR
jgi:hypothetical protein